MLVLSSLIVKKSLNFRHPCNFYIGLFYFSAFYVVFLMFSILHVTLCEFILKSKKKTKNKEYKMKNLFLTLCLLVLYPVVETQAEEASDHWIFSVPFQRIEAGSFTMGSPVDEVYRDLKWNDEDQVQVTISKSFEIMAYEVTQSQWMRVMGENPSRFNSPRYCDDYKQGMCPNNPVEEVSWDDVQKFIGKLNEALGLKGCGGTPSSSSSGCYRLPTEAEWEYATRAGTTTAYSFGNDNLGGYAWFVGNSGSQNRKVGSQTQKVGLKSPNSWGLYDVHGNVTEWVQNSWNPNLPGGVDPLNTFKTFDMAPSNRVFRGGSWGDNMPLLRSANRGFMLSKYGRSKEVGFRLVRTL